MDVKALKKMETDLADARAKGRAELLGEIAGKIAALKEIGFGYELVESQKRGRPRKEDAIG